MSDNNALREKLAEVLNQGLSDDGLKRLKKAVNDIVYDLESDIEWRMKDCLAENLAAYVEDMADNAVKALLAGNEDTMRRYLTCQRNAWNGREREHPIIHGKLFEADCIRLRREIVEAHRDVIASERILDLEAEQKSLIQQYNKLKAELEREREDRYG